MITRIIENGRVPSAADSMAMLRALSGVWGETQTSDEQTVVSLGRACVTFVTGGVTLVNNGDSVGVAVCVFSDGTTSILAVHAGQSVDAGKQISAAFIVARS
jgi:hypothetical protein